jgi:PAS domain-containing protein
VPKVSSVLDSDECFAAAAVELPYEWLFAAASESVLIVVAASGTIVAANPAAAALLNSTRSALVGTALADTVDDSSKQSLGNSLACATRVGRATPVAIRAVNGGPELSATLSLFRKPPESYCLVRLAAKRRADGESPGDRPTSPVLDAIEGAPVGFLVADSELRVEYANRAFIDMIEVGSLENLRSKSLQRWLKFTTSDSARLHAQMSAREAVTVLDTRLRSERGATREVEVRAIAVPDDQHACWGFSVCARTLLN